MDSNILAPYRARHTCAKKSIVEILNFSKNRFFDISENTVICKSTYLVVCKRINEGKAIFCPQLQEKRLWCFELPQAATNYTRINVTTFTPPPDKKTP